MVSTSRRVLRAAVLGVLVALISATSALASYADGGRSATPAGYGKFLVYIANGVYDPSDAGYVPPTGMDFQKQVMHRTDAEIAEQEMLARAFFKERFGLDEANGDVMIMPFQFDPRNDYRAYVIGGERVPARGLVVRDGGFMAQITRDTVLHGTYGGVTGKPAGAGTAAVFGEYNILRVASSRRGPARGAARRPAPLILHYQSELPIGLPDIDGVQNFRCELIDPETGAHGIAQGVIRAPRAVGSGLVQVSIRNVITFPGY